MKKLDQPSRRDFLKIAAATGITAGAFGKVFGAERAFASTSTDSQNISPNDKIQIGLIGAGGQGIGDTETALRVPGVEIVAVADLYDGRLLRAKEMWGEQIFTTKDHRELLARPEVDVVIIATPDHWHSQISIDAMNAGKDVYCEKPMVQLVNEGHAVIETQNKTGRILQVGSQRVSSIIYHKAKQLIESGAIGEVNLVEAFINRRMPIPAWQYTIPPDASPQTVDWDRFLGRAPKLPFDAKRFFRWRNYQDYGTGIGGDLFVHLFSGIHYVLGSNGPTRVMATGGLRLWNDGRDVPDVLLGLYDYPKSSTRPAFNIVLRVNFADGSVDPGAFEDSSFRFVGTEGMLTMGKGVTVERISRSNEPGLSIRTFPDAMQTAIVADYRKKYPEDRKRISDSMQETYLPPSDYSDLLDHFTNFFDAVRSRTAVVEDATFGFRAAGPALLTNISYFDNRIVSWNPETMQLKA